MRGDGDGWVQCRCGARHWGRHGAAGLLLGRAAPAGDGSGPEVLLQLRADWTHQGGTWGLPGGAVDSDETTTEGALREAVEEAMVDPDAIVVVAEHDGVDHGDWRYRYVVGLTTAAMTVGVGTPESDEVRWVAHHDVDALPLHPGFGAAWPQLRRILIDHVGSGSATDKPR